MSKPTALGCYIFAGGFTLGVRKHFDVVAHFEEGPYGVETAQHNIPELRGKVYTDPDSWPAADFAGEVDFVYGNPPCAPWSVCSADRAVPWRLDPRVGCSQRLFSLLDRIEPKVWAFESVRPTFTKGREMIDEMVLKAADRGYTAYAAMVDGINHGVPQRRPRFFLVLSKYLIDWEPTRLKKVATVGEAFAKPFKTASVADAGTDFFKKLIRDTKPGQRCAALFNDRYPDRIADAAAAGTKVKQRPSFQNIRLDPSQPSCTLTGGAKQIHPTEHRLLSVEESAVLCGYPRSFEFKGTLTKRYAQVAQAVMPPVGEYLARMVAGALVARAKVKKPNFVRVDVGRDGVEVAELAAQRALPFDPDPKKTISLPPKQPKKEDTAVKPNPCPSCAGEPLLAASHDGKLHFYICANAECPRVGPRRSTPNKALSAWNSLKPVPAPIALLPTGGANTEPAPRRRRKAAEEPPPPPEATGRRSTKERLADLARAAGGAGGTAARTGKTAITPEPAKAKRGAAAAITPPGGAVPKRGGCGARIRELLVKKTPHDKILEIIRKEFPWSKAKESDVRWNVRKLAEQGVIV